MCVESLSPEPEKSLSRQEIVKQLRFHLQGWEKKLEELKTDCPSCGKRDVVNQMEAYGWVRGLSEGIRLIEQGQYS